MLKETNTDLSRTNHIFFFLWKYEWPSGKKGSCEWLLAARGYNHGRAQNENPKEWVHWRNCLQWVTKIQITLPSKDQNCGHNKGK